MANIFNLSNDRTPDVDRNTFDLSFQNNLTLQYGYLYPVFVKEVLPGDSFKIRPTFALEAMPMVFPVQTRQRVNLHFYYCRNRPAYEDFMSWIGNTKDDADPPFIDMAANFDNMCKTGSLGDYMGLPTTVIGEYGGNMKGEIAYALTSLNDRNEVYNSVQPIQTEGDQYGYYGRVLDLLFANGVFPGRIIGPLGDDIAGKTYTELGNGYLPLAVSYLFQNLSKPVLDDDMEFVFHVQFEHGKDSVSRSYAKYQNFNIKLVVGSNTYDLGNVFGDFGGYRLDEINELNAQQGTEIFTQADFGADAVSIDHTVRISKNGSIMRMIRDRIGDSSMFTLQFYSVLYNVIPHAAPSAGSCYTNIDQIPIAEETGDTGSIVHDTLLCACSVETGSASMVQDITRDNSPFYDSQKNKDGLKISALPFRHYEAIYNTFYRDSRNNPLMVNGKPEYNKVYLNTDGGADRGFYFLRRRNWESDFLTTAVQSPQQGAAPLVGISSTGKMTFQDESGKQYQAQAVFADDGETITGFKVLSDDMPQGNLRSLIDMASTGISIADLRQVNSLQRWLEANMRKGLRYKDQMQAHYGINISYDELGMPEFIGGVSEDIRVNMVTQTTPTAGTGDDDPARPLGSYAGQASCVGTSNHEIDKYCDEHGYIIGILSITPVPNYSQLLPKHFLKRNILDYYFPEFGNLGFVPIKYNEVCPVQTHVAGDDLNGVFGYQRAWYDYLASVDEVHGEFRKSLRDYLINRTFNKRPELGEDFLLVDPEQVNEVFAVTTESNDKFLGQVYFDCKVKRPIPLFGIPRIE